MLAKWGNTRQSHDNCLHDKEYGRNAWRTNAVGRKFSQQASGSYEILRKITEYHRGLVRCALFSLLQLRHFVYAHPPYYAHHPY